MYVLYVSAISNIQPIIMKTLDNFMEATLSNMKGQVHDFHKST